MNKGIIKRLGNQRVDVQLAGSATTLPNVAVSSQVDMSTLAVGVSVLVDRVHGQPVVLHTLAATPNARNSVLASAGAGNVVINNALLADGSVPLTGNLAVTPGVMIDGYDISVLGQAIDNLQAADSVARTGYTVLTHSSHLVATIGPDDNQVLIRHAIFADKETLAFSDSQGNVEFMRVVGQPQPAVDSRGAPCWRYTVTRRIGTSPAGIVVGWAAATLVNGLTMRGYISVDARNNSPAAPNLRFVVHTDIDAGATEHIVRMGNVRGILGNGDTDYGFAVGRLTTGDKYLSYNYSRNLLALRGADIAVSNPQGVEVFRVWAVPEGDHDAGDTQLGQASGGHIGTSGNEVNFFAGSQRIMHISPAGARFRGMIWSGTGPGPQVGIGEENGQGLIAARNAAGLGQFVVRTGDENVHVHIGNPVALGGYSQFANGQWTTDGVIRARAFELLGGGHIGGGSVLTNAGKFVAGDGNNVAVIDGEDAAWRVYAGHAIPTSAPFRVNQAGEAWLTNAHITGEVAANSGSIAGWTIASGHLYAGAGSGRAGLQPALYPFYAGSETPASAPFRVTSAGALTATDATIAGTIYAGAGYIYGSLYIGSANPRIHIDGWNKRIESTNFASGTSGFRIEGETGNAEFNNITARGAIASAIFTYNQVQATAGEIIVAKGAGKLYANALLGLGAKTFTIEDPPGIGHAAAGTLWAVNDVIRLKEPAIGDSWYKVIAVNDSVTYWTLTATYQSGTFSGTMPAGLAVINYGQSGQGFTRISADGANAPYVSIATHAGSPWSTLTERARLGNLTGISGASGYGLWTDNGFFTGTVNASAGSIGGWTIQSTYLAKDTGVGSTSAGLAPSDYPFYAGSTYANRATAPFRVTPAGALYATSGEIAGWTLTSTYLAKDTGTNNTSSGLAPADYPFYAGSTYANRATAPFRVDPAGGLYATAGSVAGFTISYTEGFFAGTGASRVQVKPGEGFWAGATARDDAPFRVTNAGALTATNVAITAGGGDVTLNSNGIRLNYSASSTAYLGWYSGSTLKAYLSSFLDGSTNTLRINVQSSGTLDVAGTALVQLAGTTQVGNLRTNGGLAFFQTSGSGTGQQTITGSRGGNAALASLLTALAAYGLIVDSTTA